MDYVKCTLSLLLVITVAVLVGVDSIDQFHIRSDVLLQHLLGLKTTPTTTTLYPGHPPRPTRDPYPTHPPRPHPPHPPHSHPPYPYPPYPYPYPPYPYPWPYPWPPYPQPPHHRPAPRPPVPIGELAPPTTGIAPPATPPYDDGARKLDHFRDEYKPDNEELDQLKTNFEDEDDDESSEIVLHIQKPQRGKNRFRSSPPRIVRINTDESSDSLKANSNLQIEKNKQQL